MIIWGWGGITSTADSGEFHCPDCGPQPYDFKRVRNFFKLYFIPIIPLSVLGEYVECKGCKATYNERVLEWNPTAEKEQFEAEFVIATKRVMMKIALADGVVDESEVVAITTIFSDLTGGHIDQGDVRAELEAMKDDEEPISDYVSGLRGNLNEHGKEIVLSAALRIAMADGDFDRNEEAEIMHLGKALDMSAAHIRGVMASANDVAFNTESDDRARAGMN